jgi:hypothetical protein
LPTLVQGALVVQWVLVAAAGIGALAACVAGRVG